MQPSCKRWGVRVARSEGWASQAEDIEGKEGSSRRGFRGQSSLPQPLRIHHGRSPQAQLLLDCAQLQLRVQCLHILLGQCFLMAA